MANQITDRVSEQIETRLSDQKTRAADTVSTVARTLLSSSQQLREQGEADIGRYIERAADQVERIANYLQSTELTDVVHRVEDFGRRQPAAFMAGAFAAGFLASRFLKSSREEIPYQHGYETRGTESYEIGSNFGYEQPRSARPTGETWRQTGYAASEARPTHEVAGQPPARTAPGMETDEDRNRGV
ncbi:MAG: hypothetical protein ACT443_07195 [Gemmatimonadota bacterium]